LIDVKKQLSTSQLLTHHRAASSAAIVLATGAEILGVLFVHYNTERRFSEEEREIVHMFAEQAAIAIQNARLFTLEQEQIKLLGDLIKRE
jgi:GAF domain-containing protein